MTNSKAISLKLIDEHSILLKTTKIKIVSLNIKIIKIIFVSNNRGNITLLNNVFKCEVHFQS